MPRRSRTLGLGAAARNCDLGLVQLAWGGSISAEWAHFVALSVFAYQDGGAAAVGLAGLIRLLPSAAIAPVAASFGDHFRRERFLIAVALVGTAALAGSAFAASAGADVVVYGAAAVVGIATTLFRPALQALLPSLARTPEELIASNGATSTVESLGTLAGPLLAGVLVAQADVDVVFAAGAALFLGAAVALARVRPEGRSIVETAAEAEGHIQLLGGFRALVRTPRARLIAALGVSQAFVRGCLNVLLVVAVFELLHGGDAQVGYLTAAIGGGGLLGAFGAMMLKGGRLGGVFGLALIGWGMPIALIAPEPASWAVAILLATVGAANSMEDVALFTLFQRMIPDRLLTRALGVFWGLAMGAVAIGSIVTPAIIDLFGAKPTLIAVGLLLPLLTLASARNLREIDRTIAPAPELGLLEPVPMFAPLSIAAKERLAKSLVPVSAPAGTEVIRTGLAGDRFYIVAEGTFEIDAGGMRSSAQAGDYFGEIALLRDVPRTATVTAVTASKLYALERDAFLAAVACHPASHAAGYEVAEARLARTGATGGG